MKKIILGAAICADFWIMASWANIIASNTMPGATEAAWNIFTILF